jgi:hypothetical protein
MIRYPAGRVRIGRCGRWNGERRKDLKCRRRASAPGAEERPVNSTKDWHVNCYASEASCDILADCHDRRGVLGGQKTGKLEPAIRILERSRLRS